MAGSRRGSRDDEGYHTDYNARRRHQSQPPNKGHRAPSTIREEGRPKLTTRDDSYYDPRDVYYLSDNDGPDDHPYFASRKEDFAAQSRDESSTRSRAHHSPSRSRQHSPPPRRTRSPSTIGGQTSPRRRKESPDRRSSRRRSSRSQRPRSPDRRRAHSEERHRHRDDEDERQSRHSRHSNSQEFSRPRRATTMAASAHDDDRHRRDSRHPPSASRSGRVRSSTVGGSNDHKRSRSSSFSPTERMMDHKHIIMSAAKTALQTGAMTALKMQGEPGPWLGMKGAKVITTALSAAAVDTFIENRKPNLKGGMRNSAAKSAAQVALVHLVAKPMAKHTKMGRA